MRIGLIVYDDLKTVSGGYLYDRMLVECLLERGVALKVFALKRNAYAVQLADNWSGPFVDQIRNAHLDLLLEDELCHPSLILLNRHLRRQTPTRLVSIVHHLRCSESRPAWMNTLYARVERTYLSGVDACIYNSVATARSVQRLLQSQPPSVVAYPGGDRLALSLSCEQVRTRVREPRELRLVLLGNVIPRKGLLTLIRALALARHHGPPHARPIRLRVVGSLTGDLHYVRRIREALRRLGLTAEVELMGSLSDDEVAAVLQTSDVLAMPSTHEGFGIAYLEAMYAGLPAIGTPDGGAAEIICDGVNGLLIPPEQPAILARCLVSLASNFTLLERLSLGAFERSRKHPTWSESMSRAADFLDAL
jgi:glycosyltransferase involved in cell wall biosynthesis